MQTNELPPFDPTQNETNCCPRFRPEPWDNQELHFDRKPFVRASTFFYTTCPRCAKHYGKNSVVGVAKVR